MTNKNLIFDSEIFDKDAVLQKIKHKTRDPLATLESVEDLETFGRVLINNAPWRTVIVNFQMPDFWETNGAGLEDFVNNVRKCQETPFIFIGVTGYKNHISTLTKLGLVLTHKDYNGIHIESLATTSNGIQKSITKDDIVNVVCRYYDIPVEKLFEKIRKRNIVKARHISIYLSRMFIDESLHDTGQFFGGRDHTTVIHSCKTVKDLMDTEELYRGEVMLLREEIELLRG